MKWLLLVKCRIEHGSLTNHIAPGKSLFLVQRSPRKVFVLKPASRMSKNEHGEATKTQGRNGSMAMI